MLYDKHIYILRNNEGYLLIHNKFFPLQSTQSSDTQLTTQAFFSNANYVDPQ